MQLEVVNDDAPTQVGSYFVANYPPFSVWSAEHLPAAFEVLDRPITDRRTAAPLGLYVHIPFCRKRCKFCYYRVYTDKNAREVETYLNALEREVALYADRVSLAGRTFEFVYFGGGTPSFLSSDQLRRFIDHISRYWSWKDAREVTFECEPGTLRKGKLETIRAIGVTRLSLGVEHFDDEVLEANGRAHKSREIVRSYEWAREVNFDQINLDLIAGMIGDTESKWKATVDRVLDLDPDSVTIYQMELPHNTTIAREERVNGQNNHLLADWATKRSWVNHAFDRFEKAGYVVSSAYTLVKPSDKSRFVYRDSVWHGSDMIGTGVASFSHLSGVHYQNAAAWEDYITELQQDRLPLERALPVTEHQLLVRELVLQLKLGRLDAGYFRKKFGVEIADVFSEAFGTLVERGFGSVEGDRITLSRAGLLRADALLPLFFEPQFRDIRYT